MTAVPLAIFYQGRAPLCFSDGKDTAFRLHELDVRLISLLMNTESAFPAVGTKSATRFGSFEMDPSESLQAYGGTSNQSLRVDSYNNQLIGSDSYNFLTGTEVLEGPLKESHHSRGPPNAEGRTAQNSGGALLGGLYSSENSPSADFSNRSSQTPKSNSWESVSEAGLYSNSLQNLLISGANVLSTQSGTGTAQLLMGGLQGGSYDGGHSDPTGVYYPPPNSQQGAMQLYYVNAADYCHEFNNVGRPGVTSALLYSQQDGGSSDQQASCTQSEQHYNFPFLPSALPHDDLHQQALEAINPMGGNPLSLQGLSAASRNGSHNYSNWRNGGNEHSFIPMNDDSHNSQSQYDTDLPHYGVGRACHDLSHMHQTDHLQGDVGHGLHVDHSHGTCFSGQGLSLSLSSHQPQPAGLHYQPGGGHLSEADHINAVAQAAAQMAKTKELASRYLAGGNADLSRFRTPSRDDILGSRFHLDPVDMGGGKNFEANMSGPSGPAGCSDHFSASRFLRIAQDILNEVCRVSASKKPLKPVRSSEQYWTMAAGSSASIDGNLTSHGKEDRVAIHTEVDSMRDPISFANPSPLVTVSHILPHETELVTNLADLARTDNRDDLELKKGKLSLMLDEVEARYRRYCDHLQLVIIGFNNQAGPNAATPYTILALQAMSRHFRCLRDAIGKQLKTVKRALGEDDRTGPGETSRLRYVDQQIRQQRALQQLGMLQQHAWRPQRGLPERAVSVLRAWLFEHFLHPYPKDVDKMSLAKQTGLTRSQVSNWFINARVRLWKPMVEEMYLEEQREAEEAAMSERRAREQICMDNNSFEAQYEGCRDHSGLLNDVTRNGQSSACMPKEFSATGQDREPDSQGGQGPAGMCPENTVEMHPRLLVVEHHLNGGMAANYNKEVREPKKPRNDTYDPNSAPMTSTGVSLTLGLQNCEANLRSAMGSSSMLSKYQMELDNRSNVQLNTRADQFNDRLAGQVPASSRRLHSCNDI